MRPPRLLRRRPRILVLLFQIAPPPANSVGPIDRSSTSLAHACSPSIASHRAGLVTTHSPIDLMGAVPRSMVCTAGLAKGVVAAHLTKSRSIYLPRTNPFSPSDGPIEVDCAYTRPGYSLTKNRSLLLGQPAPECGNASWTFRMTTTVILEYVSCPSYVGGVSLIGGRPNIVV
jgi:hypothetical protein